MAAPTAKSGGRAAALQRCFATFSNGPTRGAYTEIVRNGLGARGIDYVEVFKTGSAISVRFPVYDGHGNMTACLLRDGAGGFTLTSRRAYDPWGAMRQWGTHPSGASAYQGAPSNRYVGSLGHQQDDDSGLYYMRARYYEPGSGRFISEDPAMDGINWFAYCGNNPIGSVDPDGKEAVDTTTLLGLWVMSAGAALIFANMVAIPRNLALVINAFHNAAIQIAKIPTSGGVDSVAVIGIVNTWHMFIAVNAAAQAFGGIKRMFAGIILVTLGSAMAALGDDFWDMYGPDVFKAALNEASKRVISP